MSDLDRTGSRPAARAVEDSGLASVDAIYYRDAGRFSMARDVSARARAAMYRLFVRELRPTANTTILDLGVSDEEGPETNMLEKEYPWLDKITCVGLGDGNRLIESYPGVSYVRIARNEPLPFADKAFDIGWCNAVLEHVGGADSRAAFVREILRVCRCVFLTVPNRWFPIEHHTGIPLLHWSKPAFRAALRETRLNHWSNPANLEFLSKRMLRSEWPADRPATLHYTGFYLGPFSSNLALIHRGS
jgi:SAM-dependent methyltransferase